ncbi:aminoglycoside phosphotransferase family protein [Streptomyces showdoensis]|uniref:Kinase n=1 Tax=Streptomyces showdoensis TaxID=68268 RepID=A0A2P2GJZ1_STREW|nr:aminoglycoside phosphotransferase family protein [Streptomyces showdoensis]KKZ71125.1 kinase [Streptomyces showdoensis]
MIVVPEEFVRSTVAREGRPGEEWTDRLPGLVDGLLERWGWLPEGGVLHGGVGVIVPVRRASGERAVLKVSFPHPGNVHEPDAFAVWAGRGAVRLYARDDERFAMVLERAGTSTLGELADGDEVARVAGRIGRRLAVPAPPGLPRLSERAGAWEEELQRDARELGHTMPGRVVDAAVATVRELGRDQPDTLVHGDLHAGNVLRAEREPWLAVDPKGYAGDPAYDGGTFLKTRAPHFLGAADPRAAAFRALAVYAEAAGLDRERVRRWAQLHVVQAAFWGRRHGLRIARGGAELDGLMRFADRFAEALTDPEGSA